MSLKLRDLMARLFKMGALVSDLSAQDLDALISVPDLMALSVAFAAQSVILATQFGRQAFQT